MSIYYTCPKCGDKLTNKQITESRIGTCWNCGTLYSRFISSKPTVTETTISTDTTNVKAVLQKKIIQLTGIEKDIESLFKTYSENCQHRHPNRHLFLYGKKICNYYKRINDDKRNYQCFLKTCPCIK